MTDPKYIADRDLMADEHVRTATLESSKRPGQGLIDSLQFHAFSEGADWGYSRANSELVEIVKSAVMVMTEVEKLRMETQPECRTYEAALAQTFLDSLKDSKIKTLIGETGD